MQILTADPEDIDIVLNTSQFTQNVTYAQRVGRDVRVYPYVVGVPVKGTTVATGLPAPEKQIILRDAAFGIIAISTKGVMSIASAATSSNAYFGTPVSYWAAE